ncbi:sugar phosphate isomerase/epimerase family protein [Streptosporangium sandarakinum]|uniref:sugar phosphate isomerase/epimerase family protein n=1 Tax=Streptosporangium sandarakinum TaxID=1260955 RepID=UPI0036CFCC3D
MNPATLSGLTLPRFAAVASAAGFPAVELSIQQVQAHGVIRVRNLLAAAGLQVAAASGMLPAGPVLPSPLLVDDETYARCLVGLRERLETMAAISCATATIVLNPRSGLPRSRAVEVAVHRLGELADAAAGHGITVAVEAVSVGHGLPPDLDGPIEVAVTVPEVAELLRQAGRANLRLLIDSFHWAAAGAHPGHLDGLAPGAVGHVQIADVPGHVGRDQWTDEMRLFPGEGALPWPLLGEALHRVGYTGTVSVELFNPALRALPEAEIARRALAGAVACWQVKR